MQRAMATTPGALTLRVGMNAGESLGDSDGLDRNNPDGGEPP
jgi:hypothetical protein